jgi:hypothetical protein
MDIWNQMESGNTTAASSTQAASTGYDQLKDAVAGCQETMSNFGNWQESNADKLFEGSYEGQGGSDYTTWKTKQVNAIAETQRAMKASGGAVVGQDYTQSPLITQTVKVTADTSDVTTKFERVNDDVTKINKSVNPIAAKIDMDRKAFDTLLADIAQTRTVNVVANVSFAEADIQTAVNNYLRNAASGHA